MRSTLALVVSRVNFYESEPDLRDERNDLVRKVESVVPV